VAALAWAIVIAVAVWPIYSRFAALIFSGRSSSLASLLFTLLTGLVLLVPIVFAVHQIAHGSDSFARSINQLRESGIAVPVWLVRLPIAGEW
jgi:predicted PurR-regulated permease PerM